MATHTAARETTTAAFLNEWRQYSRSTALPAHVRALADLDPHRHIARCGRFVGVTHVNAREPVSQWLTSIEAPGDKATAAAQQQQNAEEDTLLRFAHEAVEDFLESPPQERRSLADRMVDEAQKAADGRNRQSENLCRLVILSKTGEDQYVSAKTLQSNLRGTSSSRPAGAGHGRRRNTEPAGQQEQGQGQGQQVRRRRRTNNNDNDNNNTNAPPAPAPVAASEAASPAAAAEASGAGNADTSGDGNSGGDLREEREMLKRLRLLRRHGTFLPPHDVEDVVKDTDARERRTCMVCFEEIPSGGLALRMPAPCALRCLCQGCAVEAAQFAAANASAPACDYCRQGGRKRPHPIPASRLACVLPAQTFRDVRARLASSRQGRVEGWEATAACMNPACGRSGLSLFMNSPAYSCHICNVAPREGWCAFCGVEYGPGHRCSREAPRISGAEVLRLIEEEGLPVVHPCPTCLHLTIKENAFQCNHITCWSCLGEGYCGVCGEAWRRNGHNTVSCYVSRAHMEAAGDDFAGSMSPLTNAFAKTNVVAAYARLAGEEVPARLRPTLDVIERHLREGGVTRPRLP